MKITESKIRISDLTAGYKDDNDGGVYAYGGKLVCRPPYQREFIYGPKQRDAVIDTVMHGFPLNTMYWSKTGEDSYEILDGQQRTISICQYVNDEFSINSRFYHNLFPDEQQVFNDYELTVYICEGTEAEKLSWFRVINIAGMVLTNQELLNATYTGSWLADAKVYFSKRNCVAGQMADGYISGNPIRQDYLEKVLSWIADRDGLVSGQDYMAAHQHDADANELWIYFQSVINWAKALFPIKRKGITDKQEWGLLYNKYKDEKYNSNSLEADMQKYIEDDDVTRNFGIIPYLLADKNAAAERFLSIRAFTQSMKRKAYERQGGICPICHNHFELNEMEGDHRIPWSQGGHTTMDNLQMLCINCNRNKSDR